MYPGLKSRGARYVSLLYQDASGAAATKATADAWIATYKCTFDVCADPTASIVSGGSIGLPYNVIIDPRTMKVFKIIQGDGTAVDAAVESLIKTNGG